MKIEGKQSGWKMKNNYGLRKGERFDYSTIATIYLGNRIDSRIY